MSDSRTPRGIKVDRPEERGNERPMVNLSEGNSVFNLPQSFLDKHPDKAFCYVPYICGGQEIQDPYYDAVNHRGFEPATTTTYPELNRRQSISPFSKKDEDTLVKVKGQVLMVRSADDKVAEQKKYDKYVEAQMTLKNRHRQEAHAALNMKQAGFVNKGF